jgi:hypothetical protein
MIFITKFLNVNINYIQPQDQLPPPQKKICVHDCTVKTTHCVVVLQIFGLPKIWGYHSVADVDFSLSGYDFV